MKSLAARVKELEDKRRYSAMHKISEIDVSKHIAPVYVPLHDDIRANKYHSVNLPGGRGSGKSSFVGLEIVDSIMQDSSGESNAIIFRRYANTLRDSVYSQISWAIDTLGAEDLWHGSISPMSWTYKPTGAQIMFRGLDDPLKLKSIKPKHGRFKYIWFEEFCELPGENFQRSVLQSVQRGGNGSLIFRSFNPPISAANWANVFVQRPDMHSTTFYTTYQDIPAEWLGDDFLLEAERLKEVNERAYLNEYLGQAVGSGGQVFENIEIREITADEEVKMSYIFCGCDFGFAADPAAFLRVAFDKKHDTVYLLAEIYGRKLSNRELAERIIERNLDADGVREIYLGTGAPTICRNKLQVICDSAEPKSIQDLRSYQIKAAACRKYPGSVMYGIKWLQNRKIVIDPARTPNAYREIISYEYEHDKDGNFLSSVPDKDNHAIDALRYALDRAINSKYYQA
jgi:PBSX family phage terminase large subunit